MATKPKELPQFTSLTDMANQFATSDDKAGIFANHAAHYAMSKHVTSDASKVTVEQKAEIYGGFQLRFNSNQPPKHYSRTGEDIYVPLEAAREGSILIGIEYAMSYTKHAVGQLVATKPALHGIVTDIRTRYSNYASKKYGRLLDAIKLIEDENLGVTKTRKPNADFSVWVKGTLDGIKTKNKTARSRGDATVVDDAKLSKAIDDFRAALL